MSGISVGLYKHFKGTVYTVTGTAKHSETGEIHVIYCNHFPEGPEYWIRPLSMFVESVEFNGQTVPRFARVGGL